MHVASAAVTTLAHKLHGSMSISTVKIGKRPCLGESVSPAMIFRELTRVRLTIDYDGSDDLTLLSPAAAATTSGPSVSACTPSDPSSHTQTAQPDCKLQLDISSPAMADFDRENEPAQKKAKTLPSSESVVFEGHEMSASVRPISVAYVLQLYMLTASLFHSAPMQRLSMLQLRLAPHAQPVRPSQTVPIPRPVHPPSLCMCCRLRTPCLQLTPST